jgi:hypothetical protein
MVPGPLGVHVWDSQRLQLVVEGTGLIDCEAVVHTDVDHQCRQAVTVALREAARFT